MDKSDNGKENKHIKSSDSFDFKKLGLPNLVPKVPKNDSINNEDNEEDKTN